MKSTFFAVLFLSLTVRFFAQCTPPAGSVAATSNTIYYAGGSCTFYDSLCNVLAYIPSSEAVWSCSPAKTKWVLVNPVSGGYYEFPNYTGTPPQVDLRKYMLPFWKADTIFNELILLSGAGSSGKLMFEPQQLLSVKDYNYQNSYNVGSDFSLNGRTLTQIAPGMSAGYSTSVGSGLQNVQHSSWINVSYIPHQSNWGGDSLTRFRGNQLPNTISKLNSQQSITVQALGMSITAGLNVSGFAGDPNNFTPNTPYMKSYVEMFAEQIRQEYGIGVQLFNSSCAGKTAKWGDDYCTPLVNPNQPDLVLIDFGMNDIWGNTSVNQFRFYIQSIMAKIRQGNPNVEFILVANMLPDVSGMGSPSNGDVLMKGFEQELLGLETLGVVCFNMTQLSDSIYQRKGAKHCNANALHPNDYLARWYAQGLFELIRPQPNTSIPETGIIPTVKATSYPNPSAGPVLVEWQGFSTNSPAIVRCLDVKGNVLYQAEHSGNQALLNATVFNTGVVFILVEQGNMRAAVRHTVLH
jgi:lysophospholipase L1-like esterase